VSIEDRIGPAFFLAHMLPLLAEALNRFNTQFGATLSGGRAISQLPAWGFISLKGRTALQTAFPEASHDPLTPSQDYISVQSLQYAAEQSAAWRPV
jgi:hypothetical protein